MRKISKICACLGAHIVVWQHSHCIGTFEVCDDCLILYGQGNFIFNEPNNRSEAWNVGAFLRVRIGKGKLIGWELVPFRQDWEKGEVALLAERDRTAIYEDVKARARELNIRGETERLWLEHCRQRERSLMSDMFCHGRLRRLVNRKTGYKKRLLSQKSLLRLVNMLNCETHLEEAQTILNNMYYSGR